MTPPQTISIAPTAGVYQRALEAFDVKSVTVRDVPERDAVTCSFEPGALGELVSALTTAHFKLIAAESCLGTLNRLRQAVASMPTYETNDVEDALESLERVIRSLEGIAS
jgi:hypothetical protein